MTKKIFLADWFAKSKEMGCFGHTPGQEIARL